VSRFSEQVLALQFFGLALCVCRSNHRIMPPIAVLLGERAIRYSDVARTMCDIAFARRRRPLTVWADGPIAFLSGF